MFRDEDVSRRVAMGLGDASDVESAISRREGTYAIAATLLCAKRLATRFGMADGGEC